MSPAGAVRPVLALAASLGEGMHWDPVAARLWGVDIHGRRLWRWDLAAPAPESWQLPQRIGWVLPCSGSDALLLGLQQGFAVARIADGLRLTWLARPFGDTSSLRLNDAKADASGAVWAGSLDNDDESHDAGRLFRLDTRGRLHVVDSGYRVANGPAIHPEGRWMLHSDSARRTIYRFDLDAGAGRLHGKCVWKVLADAEGYPDGMCFDAEGCVWVAHWGAGCISRFAPDGRLLRRIALPASQATNVCFAGPALDRLFVTSARIGLQAQRLAEEPLAGSLFEVAAPGVAGLPGLAYGGDPSPGQAAAQDR